MTFLSFSGFHHKKDTTSPSRTHAGKAERASERVKTFQRKTIENCLENAQNDEELDVHSIFRRCKAKLKKFEMKIKAIWWTLRKVKNFVWNVKEETKVQHLFTLFPWHFAEKKNMKTKFLSIKSLNSGGVNWQCTIIKRSIMKAFTRILFRVSRWSSCLINCRIWLCVYDVVYAEDSVFFLPTFDFHFIVSLTFNEIMTWTYWLKIFTKKNK